MSEQKPVEKEKPAVGESERREFLNATFSLLKGLSLHDIHNDAVQRPLESFEKNLKALEVGLATQEGVEFKLEENILSISGVKINNHFSTVEASKIVPEHMELALIESVKFLRGISRDQIGEFFSKWALHCSVNQKSRELNGSFTGIEIVPIDPSKSSTRLKSKQLLMSPTYALQHYAILSRAVREFFEGIASNKVIPQREIRRELLEMAEIAKVNPYQLVALSLVRATSEDKQADPFADSVSEAIATALLAMAMAQELEYSIRDRINLGMVALMYNIGLLSPEISGLLKSKESLSQVDFKRVHDAQAAGVFKLIQNQGSSRPALVRLLALFEATQAQAKSSVSLLLDSRLLRLCSQFVALTSERPYRDAYSPMEAMKIIGARATTKSEGNLDPVIYYVFVRFLGVFPVGSLVLLSDNRKAVIYRPRGEKRGVPMVKLAVQDAGEQSILIDLASEKDLDVVKCLDPKREGIQVTGYFFE